LTRGIRPTGYRADPTLSTDRPIVRPGQRGCPDSVRSQASPLLPNSSRSPHGMQDLCSMLPSERSCPA